MHIHRIVGRLFIWTYLLITLFVVVNYVVAVHFYRKVMNESYENVFIWSLILSVVLLPIALIITIMLKPDPSNQALDGWSIFGTNRLIKRIGYAACSLELAIFLYITLLNTRVIER